MANLRYRIAWMDTQQIVLIGMFIELNRLSRGKNSPNKAHWTGRWMTWAWAVIASVSRNSTIFHTLLGAVLWLLNVTPSIHKIGRSFRWWWQLIFLRWPKRCPNNMFISYVVALPMAVLPSFQTEPDNLGSGAARQPGEHISNQFTFG